MKTFWKIVPVSVMACTAGLVMAGPVRPDHPIVGTWTLDLAAYQCQETYRFANDGTVITISGEREEESVFSISDQARPSGFHDWARVVVRHNGRRDCRTSITAIGTKTSGFVRFRAHGSRFFICETESMAECNGPFIKIHEAPDTDAPPGGSIQLL